METEELTKLVDGIYKNILEKFNPGARQMIHAGKAYLKALHGASTASKVYVDSITKLARQAQHGTWGDSADIGTALLRIVEVYKEIQDQQMNILKAFYVDLLVPLETNLEKDTKVIQSEQKKFMQQHKVRSESYSKAAANIKKQRKKNRSAAGTKGAAVAMDKELKSMQILEEEKLKLDSFCEESLKNAMTQERRRYGFVLERQCSIAKHYTSYHTNGAALYQKNIDSWLEVSKTREYLPKSVECMFVNRVKEISSWSDDDIYSNLRSGQIDGDRLSLSSQLRKTKSVDASCLDLRTIEDECESPIRSLSRAKSDFNLNASSNNSSVNENSPKNRRPRSMAVPSSQFNDPQIARALYAYLSNGENQLSFLEGDVIALFGERNKGWQFGENLRTQLSGWFPLAYTEIIADEYGLCSKVTEKESGQIINERQQIVETSQRMFGDTINLQRVNMVNIKQSNRIIPRRHPNLLHVPPPTLPAPTPNMSGLSSFQSVPTGIPHSQTISTFNQPPTPTSNGYAPNSGKIIKTSSSAFNFMTPGFEDRDPRNSTASAIPQTTSTLNAKVTRAQILAKASNPSTTAIVGNVSLHSSNDSGFSNDPPPQPDVDYSDDDVATKRVPLRPRSTHESSTLQRTVSCEKYPIRQTNSHEAIFDKQSITTTASMAERKSLVKRTKSFWRFGKHNDIEVLEGMALWRHRDLVDLPKEQQKPRGKHEKTNGQMNGKEKDDVKIDGKMEFKEYPKENQEKDASYKMEDKLKHKLKESHADSSIRSHDSDRTIRNDTEIYGITGQTNTLDERKNRSEDYKKSYGNDDDFENEFDINGDEVQFMDDDGLLMHVKTVNRKSILEQYNDSDSDVSDLRSTSSAVTTEDPYDCIVVDDHGKNTDKRKKTNKVVEIGKKLEKLAKSSKYPKEKDGKETDDKQTFKTFGYDSNNELSNGTNGYTNRKEEKNYRAKDASNGHTDRTNKEKKGRDYKEELVKKENPKYRQEYAREHLEQDKNRYERRKVDDYEDRYDSERHDRRRLEYNGDVKENRDIRETRYKDEKYDERYKERRPQEYNNNKERYDKYDKYEDYPKRVPKQERCNKEERREIENARKGSSTSTDIDEAYNNKTRGSKQFIPRTKLLKQEKNIADDQKKAMNGQMGFNKYVKENGHLYGPWYDLWGMDASVASKEMREVGGKKVDDDIYGQRF